MRKIRLIMLGILCAGLLVCGIGTGITLAEVSSFSYSGRQLLQPAQERTQTLTVSLEAPDSTVQFQNYLDAYDPDVLLEDVCRLETSDAVTPGTLRLEASYDTAGPEITVWNDYWPEENMELIHLGWDSGDDLAMLLSCKDQVLSDIRNRQLGTYLPVQVKEIVITVNPADAGRVPLP